MRKYILLSLAALCCLVLLAPQFSAQAAAAPAEVYFANLKDGDVVSNPVKISFGISGMKIAPAGTTEPNTSHFHLLIDTQLSEAEKQFAIPNDQQHLHFGKGQTETIQTLSAGKHTLQLVMGDGNHLLHNPPVMSQIITITVQ